MPKKVSLFYAASSVDPIPRKSGDQLPAILNLKEIDFQIIDTTSLFRNAWFNKIFKRNFNIHATIVDLQKDFDDLRKILIQNTNKIDPKIIDDYLMNGLGEDLGKGNQNVLFEVINFIKSSNLGKEDFLPIYQKLHEAVKNKKGVDEEIERLMLIHQTDILLNLLHSKSHIIPNYFRVQDDEKEILKIEESIRKEVVKLHPENEDFVFYLHGRHGNIANPGRTCSSAGRNVVEKIAIEFESDNIKKLIVCGSTQLYHFVQKRLISAISAHDDPNPSHIKVVNCNQEDIKFGEDLDAEKALAILKETGFLINKKGEIDLQCMHRQACIIDAKQFQDFLEENPQAVVITSKIGKIANTKAVKRIKEDDENSDIEEVEIDTNQDLAIFEILILNGDVMMQSHPDIVKSLILNGKEIPVKEFNLSGLSSTRNAAITQESLLLNHDVIDKITRSNPKELGVILKNGSANQLKEKHQNQLSESSSQFF